MAVQSGEVDVAFANITWTMTRETKSGVQFTASDFYDTWGVMVPKALEVASTTKLTNASVCMISGPGETNSAEYFGKIKVRFKPVAFAEGEQMRKAYLAKRCDAIFHNVSALASFRGTLGAQADDYQLLPETHSREPLAGAVRKGDDRWFDIVRYTCNAQVAGRGAGHHAKNFKTSCLVHRRRHEAPAGRRRRSRPLDGPGEELGGERHHPGRKLRRDVGARVRGQRHAARQNRLAVARRPDVRFPMR